MYFYRVVEAPAPTAQLRIRKINNSLDGLADEIKNIAQSTKEIAVSSRITAICSEVTAQNTLAANYIAILD